MKTRYTIGALAAITLWSLSFIFTKSVLDYLTPLTLVTFRVLIAMSLLLCFAKVTSRLQKLTGKDVVAFALLACAEPVGYFLFETYGMLNVSPTLACVIVAVIPLFTPLLAYFVNRERVSGRVWSGLFVSLMGVMAVILADGTSGIAGRMIGVLLLLGAVVTAMIYTVAVKRLSARFNSFSIVAWQNVFSAMILVPLVLVVEPESIGGLVFSWDWVWRVLTLGVFCSSIAFVLYADALRELGVTKTSMFINLMPGITALASFLILGESLGMWKLMGIAVTVLGLYIGQTDKSNG